MGHAGVGATVPTAYRFAVDGLEDWIAFGTRSDESPQCCQNWTRDPGVLDAYLCSST